MTTKARLLAAYAHKPVTRLLQFDCFAEKRCDDIIRDCGGYGCTISETYELMNMAPDARLLVSPKADLESVGKFLIATAGKLVQEMRSRTANGAGMLSNLQEVQNHLQDAADMIRAEGQRLARGNREFGE